MLIVPETVAPSAGDVIAMLGVGSTTLIPRLAELELTASRTWTAKRKSPAVLGVPAIIPDAFIVSPVGSVPLNKLQE
jgi:hypothetical protein